jgi:hypothetical protein
MVSFRTLKNKNRFWAGLLFAQFLLFYILSKTQFGVNLFSNLFETKNISIKNYFQLSTFQSEIYSTFFFFYIYHFAFINYSTKTIEKNILLKF